MSKKKGLSPEEKVEKVSRWFEAHPEPYTLKELQSLIPKATGVIYQSIEECVEVLVAENRLKQEKIGVQTFIWRFADTEAQKLRALADQGKTAKGAKGIAAQLATLSVSSLQARFKSLEETLTKLSAAVDQRQAEIGSAEERALDMQQLQNLAKRRVQLQTELQQLAEFDPAYLEKLKHSTAIAVEAANRWTENYYLLEDYITNRMGQSSKELRASLCIPLELDYVENVSSSRDQTPEKGVDASATSSLLCPASALSRATVSTTPMRVKPNLVSIEGGVSGQDGGCTAASAGSSVSNQQTYNSDVRDASFLVCRLSSTPNEAHETGEPGEVVVDSSTQSHDSDEALEKRSESIDRAPNRGTKPPAFLSDAEKKQNKARARGDGSSAVPCSSSLEQRAAQRCRTVSPSLSPTAKRKGGENESKAPKGAQKAKLCLKNSRCKRGAPPSPIKASVGAKTAPKGQTGFSRPCKGSPLRKAQRV